MTRNEAQALVDAYRLTPAEEALCSRITDLCTSPDVSARLNLFPVILRLMTRLLAISIRHEPLVTPDVIHQHCQDLCPVLEQMVHTEVLLQEALTA